MSLAVVGATSLFGSFLHYRRGNVDLKDGLLFGAAGTVGAIAGSPLTKLVSPGLLLLIFGLLMFVVAVMMLRRKKAGEGAVPHSPNVMQSIAAGFGVGVLTGFLGVGGGFLIVPALIYFGGLEMKKAIGTSLFVIFLNCVAGLIGHASQSLFDWGLTGLVMALAVGGAAAGTMLSHRMAAHRLQKVFAVLVLGVGAFLIAKNYAVVL
jgi:uncharacterized membrane protein YfcA